MFNPNVNYRTDFLGSSMISSLSATANNQGTHILSDGQEVIKVQGYFRFYYSAYLLHCIINDLVLDAGDLWFVCLTFMQKIGGRDFSFAPLTWLHEDCVCENPKDLKSQTTMYSFRGWCSQCSSGDRDAGLGAAGTLSVAAALGEAKLPGLRCVGPRGRHRLTARLPLPILVPFSCSFHSIQNDLFKA